MKRLLKTAVGDLLVCVLAFSLAFGTATVTQSCASASPRHVLTGAVTGTLDALTAIESTADAAVSKNLMSSQQRQALAGPLGKALVAAKAVNDAGLAWTPGAPMPQNLVGLITDLNNLVAAIGPTITGNPATLATIEGYVTAAQAALLSVIVALEGPGPTPAPMPTATGS